MSNTEYPKIIAEIESLPQGGITYKKINSKEYAYYQWREDGNCQIYEIKHSTEIVPQQCRHLLDEKKCSDTEFRYGMITGKYVIYRGEMLN